jgi:hypothetical protein
MKIRAIVILACIAASVSGAAKQVSGDEALARFNAAGNTPLAVKAAKGKQIVKAKTIYTADNAEALYLYRSGETMLIFPADDRVSPLLGYYEVAPTADERMPEQLEWWLNEYARQIAYIQTLPEGKYKAKARTEDYAPIEPLITTKWDQGTPYNILCPTFNDKLCYTGCVATAAAQVLNYFKYPRKATGSIQYIDRVTGDERSMNFEEQSFDWDNMLDRYTDGQYSEAQANAVAYLMKACGNAAKSRYAENSTSSWESIMLKSLIENFGYSDKAQFLIRDNYNTDEWENIIYQNIKNVGPIIYGGDQVYFGHCFVCDGYSGDGFFHFDWGWSGYLDGYFQLSALYPYGTNSHGAVDEISFSLNQDAIVNLTPSGNPTIDIPQKFPITWRGNLTASLTDTNTITLSHDNGDYFDYAISNLSTKYTDFEMCLAAYNPTTKETKILDNTIFPFSLDIYGDDEGAGYDNIKFGYSTNTGLSEGTYTFYPVARTTESSEWNELQHHVYATTEFFVQVDSEGNIAKVDNGIGEFPDIDELKLESPLYMGEKFKYSFDLTSYSDNDIIAAYIPEMYIYDASTESMINIAEGEITATYLKPGDDVHLTFVSNMYIDDEYKDYTGQVYFALKSCINSQINIYLTTAIDEKPTDNVQLTCDKFTVKQSGDNPENLTFDFSVTSSGGYYFGQLYAFIEDQNEEFVDLAASDEEYSFVAGKSAAGTINYNFTNYNVGEKYTASLCYLGSDSYTWFDAIDFTMPLGIDGVSDLSVTNSVKITANRAGGYLTVTAPSEIANIQGFSLDGRYINLTAEITGTSARATIPAGFTILKITLTDGTTTTAKLISH